MDKNIQKLEFRKHIRKRPGMYLGAVGSKGIINLVKYLILDTNQELKTENNFFHFSIINKNSFELQIKTNKNIEAFLSKINDEQVYLPRFHFTGLKALSSKFDIRKQNNFELKISWSLDEEVMEDTSIDYINLCEVLAQVAYLNRESEILLTDNSKKFLNQTYYAFPKGIKYIYERCKIEALGTPQFEITFDGKINGYHFQIFLGYRTDWYPNPQIMSFANEIQTICGGSLVDGIIQGLVSGCKEFVKKSKVASYKVRKKKFNNGLILICSVKGKEFVYDGSFKESLNDENVKKASKQLIKRLTLEFIEENRKKADDFLWRFDESQLMSGIM